MSLPYDDDPRGLHARHSFAVPADLHYTAIPAEAGRLAGLRRVVERWAWAIGMSADRVQDLTLATDEAMTNVVMHAYRGRTGALDLHGTYLAGRRQVTVSVVDHGRWLTPLADDDPRRTGGRGLPLIRALVKDTTVTTDLDGTCVRMRWEHLSPAKQPS